MKSLFEALVLIVIAAIFFYLLTLGGEIVAAMATADFHDIND